MVNKKTDIKISAIVKSQNSDKYLYETLESIKDLNEIILIDYNSSDDSVEIAKEYKAKIIYRDKNDFSDLDFIISNAQNDWVLVLNQNEIVPLNLLNQIANYIENPKKNKNVVSIGKKSFYLNKEIKFLKEKRNLRLFLKDFCTLEYDFSTKLKQKTKIHCINKNLKKKNEYILNFIDNNISRNIEEIIEQNKNLIKNSPKTRASIVLGPVLKFLKNYFIKGAIFDGKCGFLFCKLKYIKDFTLEVMILERNFKGEKYDI